jgi:hypothetical protein
MTDHQAPEGTRRQWQAPAACSAVTIASAGAVCATAGPLRLIAGLSLLAALACALWLAHGARVDAIVRAVGLTLAFLVLAGLALAASHALTAVPAALTVAAAALAAAWASTRYPQGRRQDHPGRAAELRPGLLAAAGALVFAVTAIVAVRYAAASATADSNGASSLAVWAYPSAGQLHVGARQPAGHGTASLRIVVTEAGVTAAAWNNVRLTPGQAWEAPALTLTRGGPVRVVAVRAGTVVASLSASAPATRP